MVENTALYVCIERDGVMTHAAGAWITGPVTTFGCDEAHPASAISEPSRLSPPSPLVFAVLVLLLIYDDVQRTTEDAMHYAIFDTGPGLLQWMDEANGPKAAIKALYAENSEFAKSDQDASEPFITVYALQEAEVAKIDGLLTKGEHIFQDFKDEGLEFSLAQIRQIISS
ncbi:MAG: hypothetical protein KA751_02465 [Comamonas sp.]|nr:hypothetical protein [Comamonas sp.]